MKFTDMPRSIGEEVYQQTRDEIVRRYQDLPGLTALVEWGTIPYPGISDMDFYVVIKPGAKLTLPALKEYTDDQRYAMMHKHFVVSEGVFPLLHYSDPWIVHMDPLLGDEDTYGVPEKPFGEDAHIALSLRFILENCIFSFPKTIVDGIGDIPVEVREFFERNKYVEYHERELKRAKLLGEDETDPSIPLYRSLRSEWFTWDEQTQKAKVEQAFAAWRVSLKRIYSVLSTHLSTAAEDVPTPTTLRNASGYTRKLLRKYPKSLVLDLGTEVYVFQKDRIDIEFYYDEYRVPILGTKTHRIVHLFPLSLSAITNNHLFHDSAISQQYTRHCSTDLESIPVYQHAALQTFLDLIKQNVEETRYCNRGKQPFIDYGLRLKSDSKAPLRARLGGFYDRSVQRVSRSHLSFLLRRKSAHIPLDS